MVLLSRYKEGLSYSRILTNEFAQYEIIHGIDKRNEIIEFSLEEHT